jgi:glutamyl-Q tRNA(Asp) synthetase
MWIESSRPYVGRFAPSPTGPLHAGSLVAALASWLDARAHAGRWLVRIEDIDTPRCPPGAADFILQQLAACGLHADAPVLWQSQRTAFYAAALAQLRAQGWVYPCRCSRKAIEQALLARGWQPQRHGEKVYPGTCRPPVGTVPAEDAVGELPAAWRLRTLDSEGADLIVTWTDRRLGQAQQNISQAVGDFVLRRADGLWAYQLAVVVDDAAQGVTDVVRGADLADNTPRQCHLQHVLQQPRPRYLHTPLVWAADGQKLSKQTGAAALDLRDPLAALAQAGQTLGLPPLPAQTTADWLAQAVSAWTERWAMR